MEVRSLIGAYAGQVRDFPVHIARQLLANGRAAPVEVDLGVEVHGAAAPELPVAEVRKVVHTPPKRKR